MLDSTAKTIGVTESDVITTVDLINLPNTSSGGGAYPIRRNRQRTTNFLTPEELAISTRIREDDNELITIINQVMKNIYN